MESVLSLFKKLRQKSQDTYKALKTQELKLKRSFIKIQNFFTELSGNCSLDHTEKGSEAETIKSDRKNPCTCQICLSEILFHVLFEKMTQSFISLLTVHIFQDCHKKLSKSLTLKQARLRVILSSNPPCSFIKDFRVVGLKEYFPNPLESALLPQFFVFRVRDFKFWLLAYFLISSNWAKFQ